MREKLEKFQTETEKTETRGERSNPILATLITSGSRLILAIVESLLFQHNKTYAFCDTDSMAVPSDMVNIIQDYFQKLNPYIFDKPLFKMEKENYENGKLQDLWFYGISSKRYVLYNVTNYKIIIRKHSSHGLGHITNPFCIDIDWEKEFWNDILDYHYKKKSIDDINEKYSKLYAVSQMSVSTPFLYNRFKSLNKGKEYDGKVKPFNFCHVGIGVRSARPLCAYKKNPQESVFDQFIDYKSGKIMSGLQYWKDLSDIFWDYLNHRESKFDGDLGVLQRKHLVVSGVEIIGKESNELEESEVFGLDDESYLKYEHQVIDTNKILQITIKKAKEHGFSENQILRIKKSIRLGNFNPRKKTIKKLMNILKQRK